MQPEDVDCRSFKDWVLKKETELRLEVDNDDTLDIKVLTIEHNPHTLPTYSVPCSSSVAVRRCLAQS